MENLVSYLSANTYPGRGILIGKSPNGRNAIIAYFIMGRSENSRNRVFTRSDGGIKTEAYDPEKLSDPSLIIYSPIRICDDNTIVTNGDQTDTIYEYLIKGRTFEEALRTRCFEPDAPNLTPRVSGMLTLSDMNFSYKLSILKSDAGRDAQCHRFFYEYTSPINGEAHIIHTYAADGNPIPSFSGSPVCVETENEIEAYTMKIWSSLDKDNKVSLFVRYIDLYTGIADTRIINRNGSKPE